MEKTISHYAVARKRRRMTWLLWMPPVVFLVLFYFYPLVRILALSMGRAEGGFGASLLEAFGSRGVWDILWFTIWQAALSTVLTLLFGLPAAYLLARYDFRGKALVQALAGIPFVMPALVVAAAFNALLGPRGWVNLALMDLFGLASPPVHFSNTLWAILVAHVFYNTTIVLRIVGDFWRRLDPRLGQAAAMLGASPWQVLRRITLPLLAPAVAAAALLIFIFDFTSFGVILVLGGPRFATLEVEIYTQTVSYFNLPLAATLALLQLLCTLGLTVAYTRLSARVSRPLTQLSRQYTLRRLSSWRERLLAWILIAVMLSFLTAPLLALATRSFYRLEVDRGQPEPVEADLTLDFYRELSINRRGSAFFAPPATAIGVSLGYAAVTVILALALGLPAAWALAGSEEGDSLINRVLDPVIMLPLGTSAVTLGLGFIVALNRPPLNLRASPILIPLAHTLVAFPFVVRSLTPALRSIRPRLRHAAALLGASPGHVFRHIDLPLIGRAVLVAAAFAFTISLGEFGATALIARPEFPTIPVVIYRLISQPGVMNYGQALALSTILMAVAIAGMLCIEKLRVGEGQEF